MEEINQNTQHLLSSQLDKLAKNQLGLILKRDDATLSQYLSRIVRIQQTVCEIDTVSQSSKPVPRKGTDETPPIKQ